MIASFLILSAMLTLPASVNELPLAPAPVVLNPSFEKMMVDLRAGLEEKKGELTNEEASYAFVRTYTDPLMEQLGPSEFLVQSHLYTYRSMESGIEWGNAVLPYIIFARVYYKQPKLDFGGSIDLSTIASRFSVEDLGFRKFFRREIEPVVDKDEFMDATEELLREKWKVDDHCCNGLLDYVYVEDAFEGWSLWHKVIGTSDKVRSAVLERMDVLLVPYGGGFKTEDRWALHYERQGKDYRPELEASLNLLRELVNEGGLPEKVFVASILERAPVFRAEDLVAKLLEEVHPFVQIRMRYLEEE